MQVKKSKMKICQELTLKISWNQALRSCFRTLIKPNLPKQKSLECRVCSASWIKNQTRLLLRRISANSLPWTRSSLQRLTKTTFWTITLSSTSKRSLKYIKTNSQKGKDKVANRKTMILTIAKTKSKECSWTSTPTLLQPLNKKEQKESERSPKRRKSYPLENSRALKMAWTWFLQWILQWLESSSKKTQSSWNRKCSQISTKMNTLVETEATRIPFLLKRIFLKTWIQGSTKRKKSTLNSQKSR